MARRLPVALGSLPVEAELALVGLETLTGTPDDVVDGGPADSLAGRDLAIGPVLLPGQVQDPALVLGQERGVQVEQAKTALVPARSVKHLALTV